MELLVATHVGADLLVACSCSHLRGHALVASREGDFVHEYHELEIRKRVRARHSEAPTKARAMPQSALGQLVDTVDGTASHQPGEQSSATGNGDPHQAHHDIDHPEIMMMMTMKKKKKRKKKEEEHQQQKQKK
mmetsp:Transcript_7261/g.16044  ORF Transcript_7261/g.16044 Transcript_7261/m.16044 type:complete len:133 (-) Transcript_7261:1358-1756(-)